MPCERKWRFALAMSSFAVRIWALAGDPGDEAIVACCDVVASELGWSETVRDTELANVRRAFAQRTAPGAIEGTPAPGAGTA